MSKTAVGVPLERKNKGVFEQTERSAVGVSGMQVGQDRVQGIEVELLRVEPTRQEGKKGITTPPSVANERQDAGNQRANSTRDASPEGTCRNQAANDESGRNTPSRVFHTGHCTSKDPGQAPPILSTTFNASPSCQHH